jgi:hypothetical protein
MEVLMSSDDLSFLTDIARQYMFGKDDFSQFMCKAVAIIKTRIEKYRDIISLDLDDQIQEGLLQALEAFENWRKNGSKNGKAAPHWWTWLYVENRFRNLAETDMETYVDDESLLDSIIMNEKMEEEARDEQQRVRSEETAKPPERKKDFVKGLFSRLSESYQLIFKNALSSTPRNTAKDLGLTKQRIIQMKNETLKIMRSQVKST